MFSDVDLAPVLLEKELIDTVVITQVNYNIFADFALKEYYTPLDNFFLDHKIVEQVLYFDNLYNFHFLDNKQKDLYHNCFLDLNFEDFDTVAYFVAVDYLNSYRRQEDNVEDIVHIIEDLVFEMDIDHYHKDNFFIV